MEKENIGLEVFYVILRIEAYTLSVIKIVLDWKLSGWIQTIKSSFWNLSFVYRFEF